jgi:glycogen debranching enzyme
MPARSVAPFDVREIPFSRRGSWLDLSPVVGLHRMADDIHLVTHQTGLHGVLRLVVEHDGVRQAPTVSATASRLSWFTESGSIEATFDGEDGFRFRGRGFELRVADAAAALTPFTGTYFFQDPIDGSAIFTSYESGRRYRVSPVTGTLAFEGSESLGPGERAVVVSADGAAEWEVAIEEFETSRAPFRPSASFDELEAASSAEFAEYLEQLAPWRSPEDLTLERAVYVLWSATVSASGFLPRESVLMSKHWMDKLWSWDHCFNAFAFAPSSPSMALDQFLAPFDFQESSGALPDSITHSEVLYNFVKPPIHGWAFNKIRASATDAFDRDVVAEVYAKLSQWTRFWLDSRRVAGHALPHYQHGNDSGWDNSTTFDRDRLIESPDLAAFLLIQLDLLIQLAHELGAGDEGQWISERDVVRTGLLELWDGEHFFARSAETGRRSTVSSLLNLLPIVAARHLPEEVVAKLAAAIESHLTEWGLATERPGSAEYEDDGYWRGPIWAPSTVLIEDGLRTAGFRGLADDVSVRFRRLCERSGFAENFDAVSGEGLRDRAYTWTASAYLLLSREASLSGSGDVGRDPARRAGPSGR